MRMWTNKVYCVRFEVITPLLMKIQDFCDMTPCILVNVISVVSYARILDSLRYALACCWILVSLI